MTGQEMLEALPDHGGGIRVVSKSGKLYDVERDVVEANAKDADPYIYGWLVTPSPRTTRKYYWFHARNVRIAEVDDQVNV